MNDSAVAFSFYFKISDNDKVVSGSHDGIVKVFNFRNKDEKSPLFALNPETIQVKTTSEVTDATAKPILNTTKINCMALYNDLIIYGDSGFNIKVLDYKKGLYFCRYILVSVENN